MVQVKSDISDISCYMNRETSKSVGLHLSRKLNCLWDGVEVYVPFSFLKNYYELYSSFTQTGDTKVHLLYTTLKVEIRILFICVKEKSLGFSILDIFVKGNTVISNIIFLHKKYIMGLFSSEGRS